MNPEQGRWCNWDLRNQCSDCLLYTSKVGVFLGDNGGVGGDAVDGIKLDAFPDFFDVRAVDDI